MAGAATAQLVHEGIVAKHLRRKRYVGEKAGALQMGLEATTADIIVPFDVDFRPPPDFLERADAASSSPSSPNATPRVARSARRPQPRNSMRTPSRNAS